ncbi:hypothetical protein, partial [Serratia marcescens]|uniref:hypothetical protein n=1 Tax=Serratia marcescens TaxID=615 RepID=UPI002AA0B738
TFYALIFYPLLLLGGKCWMSDFYLRHLVILDWFLKKITKEKTATISNIMAIINNIFSMVPL